jgi:hypothetical protein
MSKISYFGFEIPVEKFKREELKNLLKEFLITGITWAEQGYKVYFYGISGEARAGLWNAVKEEVLNLAKVAEKFLFIAGPVFSVEIIKGKRVHPFIEMLRNKKKYKNVKILESSARAYYHYMLMLASRDIPNNPEKGLLIMEKPHPVLDLEHPREKNY